MEDSMNVKKLAMSTVFIALIISVANVVSVAGSSSRVVKCTITNDTEYYADVKLIMHANGSSYNVNLYPHQTFAIPNEIDVYCPRGLQGKITYGIFSADIVPICTGNKMEGSATSCPGDCTDSTWKIQMLNNVPHFVKQ
jgi:hypothetical protein